MVSNWREKSEATVDFVWHLGRADLGWAATPTPTYPEYFMNIFQQV
jgi:hypothetical protein